MFAYSMARELDPRFKAKLKKGTPPLTERETEVLKWTSIGKTGWEIGAILGISRRTVEFHLRSIADKFDVVNRTHAVAQALRVGLIN
jgi:DNA-binding CsgD family transcriptional regulator